jgi:hypothetical protein
VEPGRLRRLGAACALGAAVTASGSLSLAAAAGASDTTNLSSCSFTALQSAVAAGGTIDYQQSCSATSAAEVRFTATLTIAAGQSVDIESNGFTVDLDGQGKHRLFTVAGGTLALTGIDLVDGSVARGAASGGTNGANGNPGSAGTSGVNGTTGAPGTAGTTGGDGTSGAPGANGRRGAAAEGGALFVESASTVVLNGGSVQGATRGGTAGAGGAGGAGGPGGPGGSGGAAEGDGIYNTGTLHVVGGSVSGSAEGGAGAGGNGGNGYPTTTSLGGKGGNGGRGGNGGWGGNGGNGGNAEGGAVYSTTVPATDTANTYGDDALNAGLGSPYVGAGGTGATGGQAGAGGTGGTPGAHGSPGGNGTAGANGTPGVNGTAADPDEDVP